MAEGGGGWSQPSYFLFTGLIWQFKLSFAQLSSNLFILFQFCLYNWNLYDTSLNMDNCSSMLHYRTSWAHGAELEKTGQAKPALPSKKL